MKTPILDFVSAYAGSDTVRAHMPGHKGKGLLGIEHLDITEIKGADDLRSPEGIILESEGYATELFGTAHTYYLTEGSTLAIKVMLSLAVGVGGRVLAARNAHKAFINAAALLDLSVDWLYSEGEEHLCKCDISADAVRNFLKNAKALPDAVYITSPDYLGNLLDVKAIAEACDEFGLPLLVDNAHGAYLGFLDRSIHPIALGAAMCADSAHKTLPALTGAAYLHISKKAEQYTSRARSAISVFASTSPSYLTLMSLDVCNSYIAGDYRARLAKCISAIENIKSMLGERNISVEQTEPLKLVLKPAGFGYTTASLAALLREAKIEPEFVDCDYVVMMLTPSNSEDEIARIFDFFRDIAALPAILTNEAYTVCSHEQAMSVRAATFAPSECVAVTEAVGRVCAVPTVSCPPAVPIVVSGEVVTDEDLRIFKRYAIEKIEVVL